MTTTTLGIGPVRRCVGCRQLKPHHARDCCYECYGRRRYRGEFPDLPNNPIAPTSDATYRQLDHWIRKGYIVPLNPNPGSGRHLRVFDRAEQRVINLMVRLVEAGFPPELAARLARAKGRRRFVDMAPGIRLEIRAVSDGG